MSKQYILGIDTATRQCSVALSKEEKIIATREARGRAVHNKKLAAFIDSLINEAGLDFQALQGIAINIGPGSFTGLRIGLSMAKGLAYPYDLPILPVPAFSILDAASKKATKKLLFIRSHKNYIYHSISEPGNTNKLAPTVEYGLLKEVLFSYPDIEYFAGDYDFPGLKDKGQFNLIYPHAKYACTLGYQHFNKLASKSKPELEPQYLTTFEAKKWKPAIEKKKN
jgi:tRNA threonylcarbamoyladenosine biosynthesis protein TsaB